MNTYNSGSKALTVSVNRFLNTNPKPMNALICARFLRDEQAKVIPGLTGRRVSIIRGTLYSLSANSITSLMLRHKLQTEDRRGFESRHNVS